MSISEASYNELKTQFGDVASWALWSDPTAAPTSNIADLSVFDVPKVWNSLNTGYVFVGLNAANHNQMHVDDWSSFHSSYSHQKDYKLRYALTHDDRFWGSYITDIIKGYPETNSHRVMEAVKSGRIDMNKHGAVFEKELDLLSIPGTEPILIALGGDTYKLLKKCLSSNYHGRILKIYHYSYSYRGMSNLDNYRNYVRRELKDCKKLI